MESQDGVVSSSSSSSSHRAETSSSKPKHHHHSYFPPTDPSAVARSSSIKPPNVLSHQIHLPNYHDRSYRPRDCLPGNSSHQANSSHTSNDKTRDSNSGGGLGFNHQYRNHNVMHASSSSQYELQNTNSYDGYIDNFANQQFEWQMRSNSQTVGNFDNRRQQYGRGDANQWRGRNSNCGKNFHWSVNNNGDLHKPGLTDQLDRAKTSGSGESSDNLHAGINGIKQDHMNTSLKSVNENKVQKYVDKKGQQPYKTVGNFDNRRQQYGRADTNKWRGRNSNSGNSRRNFHWSVTNNGDLQKPGLTDQLDCVKTSDSGESSLNLHAGIDGIKQYHMNMSLKSVHENEVQKIVDKKGQQPCKKLWVSSRLAHSGPVIGSNHDTGKAPGNKESLLNLHVEDDQIANEHACKKDYMPKGDWESNHKKIGRKFEEKKLWVSSRLAHSGPVIGSNHDTGKAPGNKESLLNLHVEDDQIANEHASKKDYMPKGDWESNHKKIGRKFEEKNSDQGPLPVSNLHSVKASGVEESLLNLQAEIEEMSIEHKYYYNNNETNMVQIYHDEMKSPKLCDEKLGVSSQLNHPGPGLGIDPHSVQLTFTEESSMNLHAENAQIAIEHGYNKQHQMKKDNPRSNNTNVKKKGQNFRDKLVQMNKDNTGFNGTNVEKKGQRSHQKKGVQEPRKQYTRAIARGKCLLSQDERKSMSRMICRGDIDILNALFLATYESLIPAEEEKSKQKQLYTLLERLVSEQWPEAQLYLYGSCANSFAASISDIDVCLRFGDAEINKSNILLRLAEILQSHNFQNVKALTLTRVPVVKFVDPLTGISCDLCMNNVLSVENTKLLRDYAEIDVRLRQLVFIVKHWARSRGVNETYERTLSSYAYALTCIHFLQQRKPAILPCLQEMEITYSVTVDEFQCAYFDRVEELRCFGSNNKENIAELVWAFFVYWAYCHDYENAVISVRTGSIISKQSKEWTSNIGADRHFISIEDPFETSHDLGRVIDRLTLKAMKVEFERAAHIMQYDHNPCVNLFEPYVANGPLPCT